MTIYKESDHVLTIALWHIMHTLGNGDIYAGRERLIDNEPDVEAWTRGLEYAARALPGNKWIAPGEAEKLAAKVPAVYAELLVSMCMDAGWYDCGMPTIEIGHKLAASLMLTTISDEIAQAVRLPFPVFRVLVPNNLLTFSDGQVRYVTVGRHVKPSTKAREAVDGFAMVTRADNGGTFTVADTLSGLLKQDFTLHAEGHPNELDAQDVKQMPLVAQLIAGICLYMTGDPNDFPVKPVGKGHKWEGHARSGPPVTRLYRLTRPVEHDFRHVISEYCAGRGKKLNLQYMVTGHWRNQPHGPGRVQRKLIFIQPFWKGPADAPIAVRPHNIGEDDGTRD